MRFWQKKKKTQIPQIGGDAAAAWDHHLTPEAKEALGLAYEQEQLVNQQFGKYLVVGTAIFNICLALAMAITHLNIAALIVQVVISVVLFLGIPGVKAFFAAGAATILFLVATAWPDAAESGVVSVVFASINCLTLIVSSVILFANDYASDYLYSKRYG